MTNFELYSHINVFFIRFTALFGSSENIGCCM